MYGIDDTGEGFWRSGVLSLDHIGTQLHCDTCGVDDKLQITVWRGVSKLLIVIVGVVTFAARVHDGKDR